MFKYEKQRHVHREEFLLGTTQDKRPRLKIHLLLVIKGVQQQQQQQELQLLLGTYYRASFS